MCSGARRCVYCEDSLGDEVEHIHPKDLYPDQCYKWENYVYACGSCNGPKNNKFAVFRHDNGLLQTVNPPKGEKASKPPIGDDVMINPRTEDPFDFCMLDLAGTFKFIIIAPTETREYERADYTFNEVLQLNAPRTEVLRVARKNAYHNFKARLFEYTQRKIAGDPSDKLDKMRDGIKSEAHPTVWKEMQRYYRRNMLPKFDNDLNACMLQ